MNDDLKSYKVYVHINKINGKMYIGQTSKKLDERSRHHGYGYKNNKYFYRAIKKYGWDNFEHLILFDGLSLEMANIIEKELIDKYKTQNNSFGYNIREGGMNGRMSDESKQKISDALKGKNKGKPGHWKGKKLPKEIVEKIKISRSQMDDNKKEEYRNKLSESKMGGKNAISVKVICVNTNEVFDSMADAGRKYNTSSSSITKCCKGKCKSAGKHHVTKELLHWEYYHNDKQNIYNKEKYYNKSCSHIRCITTGEEFVSIVDATKVYDISRSMISKCCSGNVKYTKDKTTGDILTWEYVS